MNVNNILILFVSVCLLNSFNQKKNYFLLDKNQAEYVYFINGEIAPDALCSKNIGTFFIASKQDYIDYLREKNQNSISGEPVNIFGLTFIAESKEIISAHELKKINRVDFKWLWEQKRKSTEKYIKLNNFEDLYIILKNRDHYLVYEVYREFSSP